MRKVKAKNPSQTLYFELYHPAEPEAGFREYCETVSVTFHAGGIEPEFIEEVALALQKVFTEYFVVSPRGYVRLSEEVL